MDADILRLVDVTLGVTPEVCNFEFGEKGTKVDNNGPDKQEVGDLDQD